MWTWKPDLAVRISSSICAVCYLHTLFLAVSPISTLNRLSQNSLSCCETETKTTRSKQNKGSQSKLLATWLITEWQIPATLTCHQLHRMCVYVFSVTSATHNLFLVPLTGGAAVWGPERLSHCQVPAWILSVNRLSSCLMLLQQSQCDADHLLHQLIDCVHQHTFILLLDLLRIQILSSSHLLLIEMYVFISFGCSVTLYLYLCIFHAG